MNIEADMLVFLHISEILVLLSSLSALPSLTKCICSQPQNEILSLIRFCIHY